jgi:hypothetical protein
MIHGYARLSTTDQDLARFWRGNIVFILCNSIAGLVGNVAIVKSLPADLPLHAAADCSGTLSGQRSGFGLGRQRS